MSLHRKHITSNWSFFTAVSTLAFFGSVVLLLASVSAHTLGLPAHYNRDTQALNYLMELGFGAEYGSTDEVLHKWTKDVRIKVHGAPTAADLAALDQVVAELNPLLGDVSLIIADDQPNLDLFFSPTSDFATLEPKYVPLNMGFFRVWFDEDGSIGKGRILVASEGTSQREREHLIREELTQSLGLFQDSWRYKDSIFYQGWSKTTSFGPLDPLAIQLLYSPQLASGMTRQQVRASLLLEEPSQEKEILVASVQENR